MAVNSLSQLEAHNAGEDKSRQRITYTQTGSHLEILFTPDFDFSSKKTITVICSVHTENTNANSKS